MNYAHGTIMAVPAHDDRDWDFAKKFGLKIVTVIDGGEPGKVWTGDGPHINSGFMDGMNKAMQSPPQLNTVQNAGLHVQKHVSK